MAYTLDDHAAICQAIALGQRKVRYADKEVEYHSVTDLLRAKREIEDYLTATGQLTPPTVGGVERGGHTFASYDPS